uniref:HDAg domain-containing protein n=1 Tax=Meloidogyne hapla TaxID=6305 RepID=A0A1I8BCK5_MELHA
MSSIDHHFRDQQDLVRWIENKLGSNELWGGKQASFVLTREILVELETCFQVETVADIFRNFPDEGSIQCSSKADSFFNRTQLELERIVAEKIGSNSNDIPLKVPPDLELIPQSLIKLETPERNVIKHFGRRERATTTKAAKLLEDVKKSAEQQSNPSSKKNHGLISSFPIKIRSTAKRLDNACKMPMRGISSTASALKMSGGFTNESKKYHQRTLLKRTGGAMLLDIDDLPKQNRRKRNVETITLKKEEQKEQSPDKNSPIKDKNEQNGQTVNDSLNVKADETTPVQASLASESVLKNPQQMTSSLDNLDHHQLLTTNNLILPPISIPSMLPFPSTFTQQQINNLSSAGSSSTSQNSMASTFIYQQQQPQMMATNPFENIPTTNLAALQQFESMLKDANKLTPSSYNLIISFLVGNKHNPFEKEIGPVITLPFSETVEFESLASGVGVEAILVETFFQMDYRTGEWKRLKNSRALKPDELNQRKDQLFGVNKQFKEQTSIIGQCQQMPMFFQPNSQ